MSLPRQRVLPFVEGHNNNQSRNENTNNLNRIKKIRQELREHRKRNKNKERMKTTNTKLPEEGYLYTSKLDANNITQIQKTIGTIKGNKELKYINTWRGEK